MSWTGILTLFYGQFCLLTTRYIEVKRVVTLDTMVYTERQMYSAMLNAQFFEMGHTINQTSNNNNTQMIHTS